MADDITLTVRVRDMSRGELARVNQQVNRLRQNFRNASNGANSASRNFRTLGNDVSRLGTRFRQMAQSGNLTQRSFQNMSRDINLVNRGLRTAVRNGEITRARFRAMSRDVDLLRARMTILGRQGNVFHRMGAGLLIMQDRMRRANSDATGLRRTFNRMGDWGLGGMRRASLGAALLTTVMGRLGHIVRLNRRWMAILIATVLLLGPIAQALGALLVTALGGAFVALGAFALRGNAEVKSAFQDMKGTLGSVIRESALPMKDALVGAMSNVAVAARRMQPALTAAFTATAPLVDNFIGAFTDFGKSALPGVVSALNNSESAMAGFRDAMSQLGAGFGEMFQIITQGNEEELARAWHTLGNELQNLLVSLGEFISTALNSGTATMLMVGIFRTFTGALNLVAGALKAVDIVTMGFFTHLADNISGFKDMDKAVASSFDFSGRSIKSLKSELADVDKQIADVKKQSDDIKGPAKKYAEKGLGMDALTEKRTGLLAAIAAAEAANADAVNKEVTSYRNLLDAIQAVADLNRNYLDAQAAQQQAIIDAKKGAGEYTDALHMNGRTLDITTESGIKAYDMLSKIAQTTKEATDKAQEANAPWESIKKNWKDGYTNIVSLADGMGLSTEQAKLLATQILGMPPSKEIVLKARAEDAITSLNSVVTAMKATPDAKEITVKALSADAIKLLTDLGFVVTELPDGQFTVTAKTGTAKDNIAAVQAARDALKGKGITLSAKDLASGKASAIKGMVEALTDHQFTITAKYVTVFETIGSAPKTTADALRKQAEQFGASGGLASSLPKKKFATGGSVAGTLLEGPGTKTSDGIVARLSRGEFVMRAAAVDQYGLAFMQAVNQGRLNPPGYAKGGKVSKKEKAARNDARSELTISHFGKMAGYKNDEFRKALGLPEALGSLVDSLNHWRSVIKKATSGAVEKSLLKQLDKAGKSLIKYEKSLTKVEKSLTKAKEKLDGLKQASAALRDSVKGGVMSATNITQVASGDNNVTMGDVMARMRESVDKSTAFAKALADLKKKGVSKEIIQQIAEAGIEGGGLETAGAILGASSSEIQTMNEMQKKINASAASAGKTAADAMYAAGIKAAEGLVKGLTKKKKDIEKAMMAIARAMEKAIKKALGIKSPSKVMQEVGHYTAEGFSVGMNKNRSVDTAWTSMLNTGPGTRGGASAGSSGGGQYVVPIYIGTTKVEEVILDVNRRIVRTRGGDVQKVFGR